MSKLINRIKYIPIIGLEVHIELATKSKMFCGCSADFFGQEPNTLTCPVCLGLPGALPVPNRRAVEWTIMLGLALNCKIATESKFDRKNYFYPDLPKGYQISQFNQPLARDGQLALKAQGSRLEDNKEIRIRRVHLEEDTGKLIHAELTLDDLDIRLSLKNNIKGSALKEAVTLLDFNRSGVPLVEIVTEPDIKSSEEAVIFLKKLRQIVRYLGISDADMEKGSMRIEPNVSICMLDGRQSTVDEAKQDDLPNYKVEIKNINSFKFAKNAIDYEIQRQIKLLSDGRRPLQETRGWDEEKHKTVIQRLKEEAHDYRYFPEPDIPPMQFSKLQIERIKKEIPELPDSKTDRFCKEYELSEYYAGILTMHRDLANYFENTVKEGKKHKIDVKTIASWIVNKKSNIEKISPTELVNKILRATRKEKLPKEQLQKVITEVLKENRKAVADYKRGKKEAIGFLIGQVMKKTQGKASAKEARDLIRKELGNA